MCRCGTCAGSWFSGGSGSRRLVRSRESALERCREAQAPRLASQRPFPRRLPRPAGAPALGPAGSPAAAGDRPRHTPRPAAGRCGRSLAAGGPVSGGEGGGGASCGRPLAGVRWRRWPPPARGALARSPMLGHRGHSPCDLPVARAALGQGASPRRWRREAVKINACVCGRARGGWSARGLPAPGGLPALRSGGEPRRAGVLRGRCRRAVS